MVFLNNPKIAIDEFGKRDGYHVYLLSHFHADHLIGLYPKWNLGTIYCSLLTKDLLVKHYQINPDIIEGTYDEATCWFHPRPKHFSELKPGTEFNGNPIDADIIQCSFYDANHCPGSQMFLISVKGRTILYTGDFRYHSSQIAKLKEMLSNNVITDVYIDTTYLVQYKQRTFPTRKKVFEELDATLDEIKKKEQRLVIAVDKLGKEAFLCKIAKKLGRCVYMDAARYETTMIVAKYDPFVDPQYFTNNEQQAGIIAAPKSMMLRKLLEMFPDCRILVPSVMRTEKFGVDGPIIKIPYSDHCCKDEALQFISKLNYKNLYNLHGDIFPY